MVRGLFVPGNRRRVAIDILGFVSPPFRGIVRPGFDVIAIGIKRPHILGLRGGGAARIEREQHGGEGKGVADRFHRADYTGCPTHCKTIVKDH